MITNMIGRHVLRPEMKFPPGAPYFSGQRVDRDGLSPFHFDPFFILCSLDYALLKGLTTERARNPFRVVIHNGWYLGVATDMICGRKAFHTMNIMNARRICISAHRVTPQMTGGSPGSRILYETPLYVVPTSKAKTSFRAGPW